MGERLAGKIAIVTGAGSTSCTTLSESNPARR